MSVPSVSPPKKVVMMNCRLLGSAAPSSWAMVPIAGSMVSIDIATMALSSATRRMNSTESFAVPRIRSHS